jgi:hypothetical protein
MPRSIASEDAISQALSIDKDIRQNNRRRQMSRFINNYNKDYYGGGLMVLLGLGVVFQSSTYEVGTLSKMGAGFFPGVLGILLALTGVSIALTARGAIPSSNEEPLPPEWRGWICIILSIVAFVVLGKYGGLVPASFAITFISAMGDRQNTIKNALILSLAMVALSIGIFWWALQMQFPLFQWG